MKTNYFIWSGVLRPTKLLYGRNNIPMPFDFYPTVVIDMDLTSWALPLAIHAGGPLLGKPGFHVRIGPVNIGWSKL